MTIAQEARTGPTRALEGPLEGQLVLFTEHMRAAQQDTPGVELPQCQCAELGARAAMSKRGGLRWYCMAPGVLLLHCAPWAASRGPAAW